MGAYGSGAYGAGPYGGGLTKENLFPKFHLSPLLLVDIEYPSGTIKRYSGTEARFSLHSYEGKLQGVGRIDRQIQKTLGIFEMTAVELLIADVDQEGASVPRPIKGSVAKVRVGDASMDESEYKILMKGRIDDFGLQGQAFRLVIKDPLFGFPEEPITGTINETDFPDSFPGHRDRPLPVCYGRHSVTIDDDARNRGAWPTSYVDNRAGQKKFLIARHWVLEIEEVYKVVDGVSTLMTSGTDYTPVAKGIINGERMAYISFSDAQFLAVLGVSANLPEIRVNVEGTMSADGTLLDNPVDVLNDFLSEYCGNPPIDGASFLDASQVADTRGYTVRGGLTERQSTAQVLGDLSRSHFMRLYATSEGDVAVDILAPSISNIATYREERDVLENSWTAEHNVTVEGSDDAQVINTIDYQADFHHAARNFFSVDTIKDDSSVTDYGVKKLILEMPWATSVTAMELSSAIIGLFRTPAATYTFNAPLRSALLELTEQIEMNHNYGSDGAALSDQVLEIVGLTFNAESFQMSVRAFDVGLIYEVNAGPGGVYVLEEETERELTSQGTAGVSSGDATVTIASGPADLSAVIQAGDHCWLDTVTNEGNRLHFVVATPITATTFEAEDENGSPITSWTTESGMSYRLLPGWLTASSDQKRYGHVSDTDDEFSNGDEGKRLSL